MNMDEQKHGYSGWSDKLHSPQGWNGQKVWTHLFGVAASAHLDCISVIAVDFAFALTEVDRLLCIAFVPDLSHFRPFPVLQITNQKQSDAPVRICPKQGKGRVQRRRAWSTEPDRVEARSVEESEFFANISGWVFQRHEERHQNISKPSKGNGSVWQRMYKECTLAENLKNARRRTRNSKTRGARSGE